MLLYFSSHKNNDDQINFTEQFKFNKAYFKKFTNQRSQIPFI